MGLGGIRFLFSLYFNICDHLIHKNHVCGRARAIRELCSPLCGLKVDE